MKKVFLFLVTIVMVLTSVTCAMAGRSISYDEDSSDLSDLKPFKFEHWKYGIGRGVCPVYSAPSYDAYRANDGKASVSSDSYIDIGGYENGWLLVRYELSKGGWRVGWIPPKYGKGIRTPMTPHFKFTHKMTAEETITVTEDNKNPTRRSGQFWELWPGDTYYIIAKYNYYKDQPELYYIEFEADGKTARGFILAD